MYRHRRNPACLCSAFHNSHQADTASSLEFIAWLLQKSPASVVPWIRNHPTNDPFGSDAESHNDDDRAAATSSEGANSRASPLLSYTIHNVHAHACAHSAAFTKDKSK